MLPFAILAISVIYLAAFGAGMYPGVLSGLAIFLSLGLFLLSRDAPYRRRFTLPSTCFCIAIVGWLGATAIDIPPLFEPIIGSVRQQENKEARHQLHEAHTVNLIDEGIDAFPLTRNKCGTLKTILFLFVTFIATGISSCMRTEWKYRYIRFLIGFVTAIAALGIVGQHLIPQGDRIWWYYPVPEGLPVACFVNRSHFGGFVALLCPLALLFCAKDLVSKKLGQLILGVVCFGVMSAAVVVSLSRGAFLTYVLSLYVIAFIALDRRHRIMSVVISSIVCISFVVILYSVSGEVEKRLRTIPQPGDDKSLQARVTVWKDSVNAWKDYPLIGAGAGGFRMVFPRHKTWDIKRSFQHAESEYFQLLVDGGILGLVLAIGLLVDYIKKLRVVARSRGIDRLILICAVCPLLCAMVHAAGDVAPSIPLYAVVLGSLAGLPLRASPQLHRSEMKRRESDGESAQESHSLGPSSAGLTREHTPDSARLLRSLAMAGVLIVGIISCVYGNSIYRLTRNHYVVKASPNDLATVLSYSPTFWQAWYHLGRYALVMPDDDGAQLGERCMTLAARYNPSDDRIWRNLYYVRKRLRDSGGAAEALQRLRELADDAK